MKRNSHKNFDDILEVKRTHTPICGTNSYSVFKNGKLVLMNDGDRMSVFRPDDVETIIITGIIEYRFHRVGSFFR